MGDNFIDLEKIENIDELIDKNEKINEKYEIDADSKKEIKDEELNKYSPLLNINIPIKELKLNGKIYRLKKKKDIFQSVILQGKLKKEDSSDIELIPNIKLREIKTLIGYNIKTNNDIDPISGGFENEDNIEEKYVFVKLIANTKIKILNIDIPINIITLIKLSKDGKQFSISMEIINIDNINIYEFLPEPFNKIELKLEDIEGGGSLIFGKYPDKKENYTEKKYKEYKKSFFPNIDIRLFLKSNINIFNKITFESGLYLNIPIKNLSNENKKLNIALGLNLKKDSTNIKITDLMKITSDNALSNILVNIIEETDKVLGLFNMIKINQLGIYASTGEITIQNVKLKKGIRLLINLDIVSNKNNMLTDVFNFINNLFIGVITIGDKNNNVTESTLGKLKFDGFLDLDTPKNSYIQAVIGSGDLNIKLNSRFIKLKIYDLITGVFINFNPGIGFFGSFKIAINQDILNFIFSLQFNINSLQLALTMKGKWNSVFGVSGFNIENLAAQIPIEYDKIFALIGAISAYVFPPAGAGGSIAAILYNLIPNGIGFTGKIEIGISKKIKSKVALNINGKNVADLAVVYTLSTDKKEDMTKYELNDGLSIIDVFIVIMEIFLENIKKATNTITNGDIISDNILSQFITNNNTYKKIFNFLNIRNIELYLVPLGVSIGRIPIDRGVGIGFDLTVFSRNLKFLGKIDEKGFVVSTKFTSINIANILIIRGAKENTDPELTLELLLPFKPKLYASIYMEFLGIKKKTLINIDFHSDNKGIFIEDFHELVLDFLPDKPRHRLEFVLSLPLDINIAKIDPSNIYVEFYYSDTLISSILKGILKLFDLQFYKDLLFKPLFEFVKYFDDIIKYVFDLFDDIINFGFNIMDNIVDNFINVLDNITNFINFISSDIDNMYNFIKNIEIPKIPENVDLKKIITDTTNKFDDLFSSMIDISEEKIPDFLNIHIPSKIDLTDLFPFLNNIIDGNNIGYSISSRYLGEIKLFDTQPMNDITYKYDKIIGNKKSYNLILRDNIEYTFPNINFGVNYTLPRLCSPKVCGFGLCLGPVCIGGNTINIGKNLHDILGNNKVQRINNPFGKIVIPSHINILKIVDDKVITPIYGKSLDNDIIENGLDINKKSIANTIKKVYKENKRLIRDKLEDSDVDLNINLNSGFLKPIYNAVNNLIDTINNLKNDILSFFEPIIKIFKFFLNIITGFIANLNNILADIKDVMKKVRKDILNISGNLRDKLLRLRDQLSYTLNLFNGKMDNIILSVKNYLKLIKNKLLGQFSDKISDIIESFLNPIINFMENIASTVKNFIRFVNKNFSNIPFLNTIFSRLEDFIDILTKFKFDNIITNTNNYDINDLNLNDFIIKINEISCKSNLQNVKSGYLPDIKVDINVGNFNINLNLQNINLVELSKNLAKIILENLISFIKNELRKTFCIL